MSFDYAGLKREMENLTRIADETPDRLQEGMSAFLGGQKRLPPECAELVFWTLSRDFPLGPVVRCFDWYCLSDVYEKLTVEHDEMPRVVLEYVRRHPALESEELADFLWLAQLCRLAVQNAWQLSYVERLELFQAFVQNMTVYAAHTIQPEAWNDQDVFLFMPELRLVYHVNQAYVCLEQENLERYTRYLDLAGEDCPDLLSCVNALKALPEQKKSPLEGMSQAQIQAYALQRTAEIKKTFRDENWLETAELVKAFDRDGFEAKTDFDLLNIQCQLARRGLLW